MNDKEILDVLTDSGAIRTGHFQLTSGLHSDTYVQCARVLEYPALTTDLAREMAARLPDDLNPNLVIAPAVGGIIIGFAVAQALNVRFIFSERQEGVMVLRRAFHIPADARVLIVEDVVTTGGSVQEVVDIVESAGATVVGVTSIIDRGGDRAFDDDYFPLLAMKVESWNPADCAQCAEGTPIDSPGSRRLA
ncbi:MAG: orotate phosphoribosyltransferase [Coriobacteriia bacterium]|nr:orotate phosphoribosyltransferase [Coriobacteriia bacterium]MCL2870726.1 orotate phosphoribosyltransferase [Coriobacteriia bacterium]